MAEDTPLSAEMRERAGKGAARATRRAGRIPAIIYGDRKDPVMVSLDPVEVDKQIHHHGFYSRIFAVQAGGDTYRVLARDIQFHPVTDRPLHVDFLRFGANTLLHVDVEVVFENEGSCPGLRRGGVLNIVRHTVELVCKADSIPEMLSIDLSGLDIGDSIHISHIQLPPGVRPAITDRDFTVATIAAPTVAPAEGEEEGAAPEAAEEAEAAGEEEESGEAEE